MTEGANHPWQSTLFTAFVALAARSLHPLSIAFA